MGSAVATKLEAANPRIQTNPNAISVFYALVVLLGVRATNSPREPRCSSTREYTLPKGRVGRKGGECPLLKSRLPTLFDRITQPSKSISFSSYFRISRSIYDSFSLFFFSLSFFDRDKSYCAINDKRTNECVCIKKEKRQWETPLNNLGWKIVKSINRIDRKIELLEIKGVLFAVIMIIILNFFVDRLILLVVTMVNNCIG